MSNSLKRELENIVSRPRFRINLLHEFQSYLNTQPYRISFIASLSRCDFSELDFLFHVSLDRLWIVFFSFTNHNNFGSLLQRRRSTLSFFLGLRSEDFDEILHVSEVGGCGRQGWGRGRAYLVPTSFGQWARLSI